MDTARPSSTQPGARVLDRDVPNGSDEQQPGETDEVMFRDEQHRRLEELRDEERKVGMDATGRQSPFDLSECSKVLCGKRNPDHVPRAFFLSFFLQADIRSLDCMRLQINSRNGKTASLQL
jgi:hypothetical protein